MCYWAPCWTVTNYSKLHFRNTLTSWQLRQNNLSPPPTKERKKKGELLAIFPKHTFACIPAPLLLFISQVPQNQASKQIKFPLYFPCYRWETEIQSDIGKDQARSQWMNWEENIFTFKLIPSVWRSLFFLSCSPGFPWNLFLLQLVKFILKSTVVRLLMFLIFMGRRFRDSDVNKHKEFSTGTQILPQRVQMPPLLIKKCWQVLFCELF